MACSKGKKTAMAPKPFDPAYAQSLVRLTAQAKKPSAGLVRQINAQVARTVMAVKAQSGGD